MFDSLRRHPLWVGCSSRFSIDRDFFAAMALAVLLMVAFGPVIFRGHVITPHDNRDSFRAKPVESTAPELSRLSDINIFFIPKLELQLRGDHEGWVSTWNPYIQLGKPASLFGGYSKAYPITYLLSLVTTDPYRVHAWLSLITVSLLTFFAFFLLRSLSLRPPAAFIAAVGLGINTRSAYWLGFTQTIAWATWSVAIMWLVCRLSRRIRPADWLFLVFACYCLLIGARHQATLRMAYLVVPFVIVTIHQAKTSWKGRIETLGAVVSALVIALALAFPLQLDMAKAIQDSTRFNAESVGFVLGDRAPFFEQQLSTLWNAFALGNPVTRDYLVNISAINFTPFFFALLASSLFVSIYRRSWLFFGVLGFFLAMVLSPAIHEFAIRYLGFGFSRGNPLGGLYVPAFLICGYVADSLLADRESKRVGFWWPAAAAFVATVLGASSILIPHPIERVDWGYFLVGIVLSMMAMLFLRYRSPVWLYVAALLMVATTTAPALVHRPRQEMVTSSALVDRMEELLADGGRFAKFGRESSFLQSNQEVLAGLPSIHSYDSLSSRSYGGLTRELSDRGVRGLGRRFTRLDNPEKLAGSAMSYTGIGAILSHRRLRLETWRDQDLGQGRHLLIPHEPPRLLAQISDFQLRGGEVRLPGSLGQHSQDGWTEIVQRRDNYQLVATRAVDRQSLLFLSLQFHRSWIAKASGEPLDTVRINDFYLGVLLPPGTEEVEIRFEPLSRFAWVPLVFFAFSFASIASLGGWKRLRKRASGGVDVEGVDTDLVADEKGRLRADSLENANEILADNRQRNQGEATEEEVDHDE